LGVGSAAMIVSIRIPQLGEGLQEALLVEFLRKAGDTVKRDEPLYVMETDKATTDVESPYTGKLIAWTVSPGSVLPIGAEIGKMEVAEGVKEMPASHAPAGSSTVSPATEIASVTKEMATNTESASATERADVVVPPKTRKYLKDLNLLDQINLIPVAGSKMMPEDVDAYVAAGGGASTPTSTATPVSAEYDLVPLPKSQISLNYRLHRSAQACVPVTLIAEVDWTAMLTARNKLKHSGGPTGFAMACWAVVQAMKEHWKFRSSLSSEGNSFKVFHRVNLGVAVALPGDEMLTAVIRGADALTPAEFFAAYENQVSLARDGQDQADESTTLIVSNIGKVGMRIGIPAIVVPAVATLAIGEVFQQPVPIGDSYQFQPTVTATLSFDHRVANGVGAANFLNEIKQRIQEFTA
jgi:pyruvate/2-oxoglutarate dehydrogenase complex dihydrolipoamide acyltransferase (E2) component